MLGRGYREFTQHFPEPGWVEHDPEEIFRVSLEAMREALAAAGERPVGLGITNQRETVVLWDRRTLSPVAPRDRLAGPPHHRRAAASSARAAPSRCSASAPAWWPTPISRRPSSNGCCATASSGGAPARESSRPARWRAGWSARLTGGRVHVTDHTNASRTLLYDLAARAWDPDC